MPDILHLDWLLVHMLFTFQSFFTRVLFEDERLIVINHYLLRILAEGPSWRVFVHIIALTGRISAR